MCKVLVISEKPTAAKRIAEALDENNSPKEIKKRKVSYYECSRNNETLIVVYALGHLYELRQTEKGWKYPRLEMEWVPRYEVDKKATNIKPIINLIKTLSKGMDKFVVATDYDIEGSLIGYLTIKYACGINPAIAQRMRFSTLTNKDLEEAYCNTSENLNFPMIQAGYVRHEIDWLYGINLTRALTLAIKKVSGWFRIVSTGRVQGPTLAFVAERNRKINLFIPVPFWTILVTGNYDEKTIQLEYSKKRIGVKSNADAIANELRSKTALIDSIKNRRFTQTPPVPFNLSGLQAEGYRQFGFKPSRTLAIAQRLYLDALISYPRTSSQKIPDSIDVKKIFNGLANIKKYTTLAKQFLGKETLIPIQGKKTDPAHPAIHPTGMKPGRRLTPSETKLYDLIIRRFFALFANPAVKESVRADIKCESHLLYLRGLRIIELGWISFYEPYATKNEKPLPPIKEGDKIQLESVITDGKYTSPPPHFNPSSLVKKLEKENLGTKATRAKIADSLKSRGYTLSDKFELSPLGFAAVETLENYIPQLLSAELTRQLEEQMEKIQLGLQQRESVLDAARGDLLELLGLFQIKEEPIGQALVSGLQGYWKAKREIGVCPKCGTGTLVIIRSPKSGKRFVGCTNYKEKKCDLTFPLPQRGEIIPLEKMCPHCGYQMIKVLSKKRAWETCINWTKCSGRHDDLKALELRRLKAKNQEKVDSEK